MPEIDGLKFAVAQARMKQYLQNFLLSTHTETERRPWLHNRHPEKEPTRRLTSFLSLPYFGNLNWPGPVTAINGIRMPASNLRRGAGNGKFSGGKVYFGERLP
jgi:hypothetical protein